ncbi:hypothetical protein [Hymenobacter profundi]|uniref:Glycosyl transferase n=1 Tax=Hymenobacter profundi TaxID=1982110 RepID=A0ABS6WVU8_9BACT|nr:hypothetical protein [Hymenobacter profundi]MBW3127689.1 hypothetical protein [Hymenobacter profundi]
MKNLVLLSYGNMIEHRRAIGAVMSFWAWYSGNKEEVRTIIYTDNPDYFRSIAQDLPLEYVLLTLPILDAMLNGGNYIHRRKIAIIDETYKKYPLEEVLFIDSDTFFIADPKEWFNSFKEGKSFMHVAEFSFEKAVQHFASFQQEIYPISFINLIESKKFYIDDIEEQLHRNQLSWNSGVLGLPSNIAKYMKDIFALSDEFYEKTSWRISEQLAFSLVLQLKTEVHPSNQYVYHYWNPRQKVIMDSILTLLFNEGVTDQSQNRFFRRIRLSTKKWKEYIELNNAKYEIANSFNSKYYLRGCKYIVHTTLKGLLYYRFNLYI